MGIDGIENLQLMGRPGSKTANYFWKCIVTGIRKSVEPDGKWTAWDNEDKTNDTHSQNET